MQKAMRFVQLRHEQEGRRVAVVEDGRLRVLDDVRSLYDLAIQAIREGNALDATVRGMNRSVSLDYDDVYADRSDWKLLPPLDFPGEPSRCLVSGTGLTHKASAENRAKMHQQTPETVTDSMRMYQWGLDGGSPPPGEIGAQPEWFYKGNGSILRAHNEPLLVPPFAEDGGEEPEVAGAYVIAPDGTPCRVGLVTGNEFSDHKMERRNYLYLAPSKLRCCAIGPELVTGVEFADLSGTVAIERGGATVWSAMVFTGERNMSHTIANLEHHHFKYPEHRRPGDVHIHFYGADAFSFGAGFALERGDWMSVSWPALGRALRNPLEIQPPPPEMRRVKVLG